jgi:AcrR family transcriptional regulator
LKQNPQEMRKKILKESARLFLSKGFEGTSIKEIAEALQLTKGAIYWHFKSKNDLLETILDEFEKSFLNRLIATVEEVRGDYVDKFMRYHKYSTEFARNNRELCVVFVTLTGEMAGSGKELEKKINGIFERYHTFLCSLIEEGKREGSVRNEFETSVLADVIIGMHNGTLLQWHMKQSDGAQFSRVFRRALMYGTLKEGVREKKRKVREEGEG